MEIINNDKNVSSSNNNGKLRLLIGSVSRHKKLIIPAETRFAPNDQQLISYYLRNKVTNQFLVPCDKIRVVNLYDYHPQQLTGMSECERDQKEWYYFTQRNRKCLNGRRPNRSAGNGYWKVVGCEKTIKDNGGDKVCGYRRSLDYYEGKFFEGTKTVWKMHEYRLIHHHNQPLPSTPTPTHHPTNPMKMDEWVLCKIYKKKDSKATPNCGDEMSEHVVSDSTSSPDQYPDDQENYVNNVLTTSQPSWNIDDHMFVAENYVNNVSTTSQPSWNIDDHMFVAENYVNNVSTTSQPSWNIDDHMFDEALMNLPNNAAGYDVYDLIAEGVSSCHDHNQSNQQHQISCSCMLDDHHQMMNWIDWNNSWPNATIYDSPHHSIAHGHPQYLLDSVYCYQHF